ncbi:MAG TPA: hypothetical protein PLE48_09755 [Thiobacillus sp.]|nr:MAG: hypothetical protein B7Y50_14100 [Hydrogenophilales bacterium 28-61-11]OYZ58598.1 MAG: hypothetical protein B7Y21_02390 [Hydrogenophilales bacterium 16-61-112]OZA48864.1 MAG: hypothetical protein B7X81_02980 [Hydrogenophilales bacterium 17-61-76]HQT30059.1 hypothetical protein [Thiobacillus sp.]HQT70701.1 hypothetical protein [Thiobacillus sp.]
MKALALLLMVLAWPAQAAWEWSAPLTVNLVQGAAIFPHLESANRRGVAVSGDTVGVVWEDNRSGSPQCYLATKVAAAASFQPEIRLGESDCYEPVLVALGEGRFVAAWESAGKVHARVLPGGAPITLSDGDAAQITLAAQGNTVYAAWAAQAGRFHRIVVARLALQADGLDVKTVQPVEAAMPTDEQGWPALAVAGDGSVTVAWEDRRYRHSVPMVSHSRDGRSFASPARLTDHKSGRVDGLGAGTGAMRPTLSAWGPRGIAAVWLDKRDFLSGYDVYAAFDAGNRRFGKNVRVQDSFGDNMAQWHAQIVGAADGSLVALWDDARDGTPDVWLSEWTGDAFGDDVAVPAAAGPGQQSDPLAVFDAAGSLHAVWLDRDEATVTRIRYAHARRK